MSAPPPHPASTPSTSLTAPPPIPNAPASSPGALPNGTNPSPPLDATSVASASTLNGSQGQSGAPTTANSVPTIQMPATRKDKTLREFMGSLEENAPIIPDAVTDYYLSLSGLSTSDLRLRRLLALATQKFIADIAADAYQYSRIRQNSSNAAPTGGGPVIPGVGGAVGVGGVGGATGGGGGQLKPVARPGFGGSGGGGGAGGRTVLTMEDLGSAVGEYGVNTRRPEFYR